MGRVYSSEHLRCNRACYGHGGMSVPQLQLHEYTWYSLDRTRLKLQVAIGEHHSDENRAPILWWID